MTLTITPLNTRDGGQQVDTRAMPRPHRIAPAIPTTPAVFAADRYSLLWFAKVALAWSAASAAVGFGLAYLVN